MNLAANEIVQAAELLAACLREQRKVLMCGNGGSAADAQHFAAELVGRFEKERVGLPAIALTTDTSALTAIANDYGFVEVFARQIKALANQGDVLVALSTSGNSANVVAAVETAQHRGLPVIAVTGGTGGKVARLLQPGDLEIRVPVTSTARIQEVHILVIHCLCALIEQILFSEEAE